MTAAYPDRECAALPDRIGVMEMSNDEAAPGVAPTALRRFEISSDVEGTPERLWRHALSPDGVNAEFVPLLRMTFPPGIDDLVSGWAPGERRFRSWLLLFGFLPVDYDDIAFVEVEPPRRFLERSVLFSARLWQHERILRPVAGGVRVTDRIGFAPRWSILGPLQAVVFRAVFALRHRNLRRRFGRARATG